MEFRFKCFFLFSLPDFILANKDFHYVRKSGFSVAGSAISWFLGPGRCWRGGGLMGRPLLDPNPPRPR